jgi:hypothetical protein
MSYKIRNWENYQHFKNGSRNPPWIKLYKDLLNNPDWHELDGDSCKVLIMLWMVASENSGNLPDLKKVAFRLRMNEAKLTKVISGLSGWVLPNDINMISSRYQDDIADKSRVDESRVDIEKDVDVDVEVEHSCSELEASSKPYGDFGEPPITFPTKGTPAEWVLPMGLFYEIELTFKDAPILDWIKQARLWTIANPTKQKTARGMPSFLIGWVTRQNDRPAQPRSFQANGKAKPNLQEALAAMPKGFQLPQRGQP